MADTIYFFLAVGVTSAVIFWLAMRADRISDRVSRRRASDVGSYDAGVSSTNDGWVASWFGPTHSSDISGSWDSSSSLSSDGGGGDAVGGGGSSD